MSVSDLVCQTSVDQLPSGPRANGDVATAPARRSGEGVSMRARADEPAPCVTLVDSRWRAVGSALGVPARVVLPGGLRAATAAAPAAAPDAPAARVLRARVHADASATAAALANSNLAIVDGRPLAPGTRLDTTPTPRLADVEFLAAEPPQPDSEAPLCTVLRGARARAVIHADVLACVPVDATFAEVRDAVVEGLQRVQAALQSAGPGARLRYFAVLPADMLVGVAFSAAEETEDEDSPASVARRLALHKQLMLREDRPLLRRRHAVDLDAFAARSGTEHAPSAEADGGCEGRLADVHVGVRPHGLGDKGVTVHIVRGRYLYCHYLQDKFNDSGWGCAYRSLQTLMSWCVSEGLTSFAGGILPTHREIQQALVDVGDKPPAFLGTRDWIGANEVCYALEKLTGVTSRIVHVSHGSEMEGKGRELARHFDDHGSPVMVGGGVLAWTILGVARDARTGKTRFLILDPHYEGPDTLTTIQGKGWVAWKSADIFKPSAFYNLCMPLRPMTV